MALQGTNISASTLDGAINASVTSLAVVDGSTFPSVGDFWIRIDDEIIKVGARSTNTLSSLTRGQAGGGASAAASHSSGAAVTGVLTSQAITQLRADITRWGTHATMDGLTDMKSGDVFYFDGTDTPYTHAVYNGSSWDLYYGNFKCTPFVPGDFTYVNQGSSTVTDVGDATLATVPVGTALEGLFKTELGTPYTITMLGLLYPHTQGGSINMGLSWRDSVADDWVNLYSSGIVNKWTGASTFSANYTTDISNTDFLSRPVLFEISDNGTNRISRIAPLGFPLVQTHSVGNTDFLTADQIGVFFYNNSGTGTSRFVILSYEES